MPHVVVYSAMEPCSSWAHDINTIKMADGFAKQGCRVSLVTRHGIDDCKTWTQIRDAYGLHPDITWVPVAYRTWGLNFDRYLHHRFSRHASKTIIKLKPDLLYARDNFAPVYCSAAGIPSAVESHASVGTVGKPFDFIVDGSNHAEFRAWVTISSHLADYYHSQGVPKERLIVLPDSVDMELFGREHAASTESPFVSGDRKKILYAGHLYDYKGIPTVLQAAQKLTDYDFHFIGGWPEDVQRHQSYVTEQNLSNVYFHGLKPFAEVPRYLWHADLLLLPPSRNHPSAKWTSPVKLGEYMASGTPVVASDIPALLDWVDDSQVWFFNADDADLLCQSIQSVLQNPAGIKPKIDAAFQFAETLTYSRRAGQVLEFALGS
ncbi:MAG: glycosyltransferase involved in cell wall biosynthesis [Parasphingorhabdus sp.]